MNSAYLRSKHTRAGITWMQSADIQCAVSSYVVPLVLSRWKNLLVMHCELDASQLFLIRWRYAPHQRSSLPPSPYLITARQFDRLSPVFAKVLKHAIFSTVDDTADKKISQSDTLGLVAEIIAVAFEQYHPLSTNSLTHVAAVLLSRLFTTILHESDPRLSERAMLVPFV
jgi:hypothetical protein